MSITSCYDALRDTVATGISAKSKYTSIPISPPQRLPAVICMWRNTESESIAFSSKVSTKFARNAMRRTHAFDVVVVIGQTGLVNDEDLAGRATAESLLNAIDNDTELGGVAKLASVLGINQGLLEWDQQAFFTIRANVSVIEEVV
jgi:hypothetical protein